MEQQPPRPMSAFFCFRHSARCHELIRGVEGSEQARAAGDIWNNMTEEERAPYRQEAEAKKREHEETYPDYEYRPQKRQKNKRGQHDVQGAAQMFVGPSDTGPSTSSAAPMVSAPPSFQAHEHGVDENVNAHDQLGIHPLVEDLQAMGVSSNETPDVFFINGQPFWFPPQSAQDEEGDSENQHDM